MVLLMLVLLFNCMLKRRLIGFCNCLVMLIIWVLNMINLVVIEGRLVMIVLKMLEYIMDVVMELFWFMYRIILCCG